MRGFETCTKANPVCNTLDETAWAGALAVVLETVDDFVDEDSADFICATVRAVHNVLARKVDLLDRVRAGRVGYTVHGSKDELDGLYMLWCFVCCDI